MPYDPTLEALVAAMRQSLDHDADMTQGYLDQLRHLTVTLTHILADPEGHVPTPEQEAMMRQALSILHPSAGDAALGYGEVVQRLQVAIERELSRWTSSMVQPRSFSGQTVLPVGGGEWEPHTAGTPVLSPLARL
jgi:hypothetical protein